MSGFSSEMRVADDEDPRASDGSYDATARIVDAGGTDDDTTVEAALRPRRLDEFPGQPKVRDQLGLVLEAARRRGVAAAVIGNTLEFYDFTTYAFFAVTIGKTFFPTGDAWISLLASVAIFGVGFVTRPIGGVFIGAYADQAGRKPAMILTIALMAVGMLMLALTPGYDTIGVAAPILVVLGRLIQGFALGGEVGPSTAYLIESAPAGKRGFYASWQLASQGIAILAAGTIGLILSLILSSAQMQLWGWRIPFLLGLLIIPVGLYIRRAMP